MNKIIAILFLLSSFLLSNTTQEKIANQAVAYKGNKYAWGGTNPNYGADCSGFMQYLYKKEGLMIPRTANAQSKYGFSISKNELKKGDMLFFNTDKQRGLPVTHVGIYLGNGKFAHAKSRKAGIVITDVSEYAKSFVVAKRFFKDTQQSQAKNNTSINYKNLEYGEITLRKNYQNDLQNNGYDKYFKQAQKETGIDWRYLKAIAYQETSLTKDALYVEGDSGRAKGLFQFTKKHIPDKLSYANKIGIKISANRIFSNPYEASKLASVWILSTLSKSERDYILKNKDTYAYIPSRPVYFAQRYNGLDYESNRLKVVYGNSVMSYFNYLSKGQV